MTTIEIIKKRWVLKPWRFRFVNANGNITGNSAQSYYNRKDCEDTVAGLQKDLPTAKIVYK